MERLYGVLTTRFHTLLRPSRFTTVSQMIEAVKAMANLHNMIVLQRRGLFLGNRRVSAAAAARSGGGVADDGMVSGGMGGGVTAPPPLGSTAAGSDDLARRGDGGAHDGSMGSGGVGRGVAATRTLGFGAAGGDGPDFQGGGAGHVGVVQAQLEPVPGGSIPEEHIGKDPSPGSSLLFLHARAACTDNDKLVTLRDDLAEHVYGQYGEYLARHLERCVTWTWRPISKELWERGTASTTWNAFSSLRFFFLELYSFCVCC